MVSKGKINKLKVVVFPNPHFKSSNPYLKDLCHHINAINKDELYDANIVNLYKHLFDGNTYIFNWPENLCFRKFGYIQIALFFIAVIILKTRKVKIVWIFHNIAPHQGHTWITRVIYNIFFRWSNLIIAHSQNALKYIKMHTSTKSVFIPHPFRERFSPTKDINYKYDIIIWGSIYRYKGILEFLTNKITWTKPFKVLIIGKCNDSDYDYKIKSIIDNNTIYQNRFADKKELETLILSSRYVVFPYIKDSISSSGALIDSLLLGKTVIGPNVGAFQELSIEGLCYTFDEYGDIFDIISKNENINIGLIERYVNENVWDTSVQQIINYL